jgi:hypothetical protein
MAGDEWVEEETVMYLEMEGEAEAYLAKDHNEGEGLDCEILELYSVDDARVWAESFIKKVKELYGIELDLGWVQGWFANAMCVALDLDKKRRRREVK